MLVCSIMDNKHLPSPWQTLAIPHSFSEVIHVDSSRTRIYGPFAVAFEYRDDASLDLDIFWPNHAGEYALCLEISKEEEEMNWSWYSNRVHNFLPDELAQFQGNTLHFVCSAQNRGFKHVSFKALDESEWINFLGSELPQSMEERVKLITEKYW